MRIVGGKDYYDVALRHGHDDHSVFVRETNRLLDDNILGAPNPVRLTLTDGRRLRQMLSLDGAYETFTIKDSTYRIGRTVVIFCGKVHHGLAVSWMMRPAIYFWQAEKWLEWLQSIGAEVAYGGRMGTEPQALDKLFLTRDPSNKLAEWLIQNMVTVGIRLPITRYEPRSTTWEINSPRLGYVEFYRKINPYEAFQEIEMWISGVLPQESPDMAIVDDETRIAKHGFDKTSFRKPKASK